MAEFQQLLQHMAQLTQALSSQTQATASSVPHPGTPHQSRRKLIDSKYLKFQGFAGEARAYVDWSFHFKRTLKTVSEETYALLVKAEMEKGVLNEDALVEFDDDIDVNKYTSELYDLICQACSGEALTLLRSVEDMKGLTAWHKLRNKFNPKTMARAIRLA